MSYGSSIVARLATCAAAAAFCSFLALAPARADTTVTAGTVAPGPTYWPLYVGQELGYFKDAGLKLEVYTSGGTSAQQVVANSVNIACSGFPDFMRASYQGAPIKIFENAIGSPPYTVYAKKDIKSAKDLKGKTIMIGDVHDVTLIFVKSVLATAGLKASDVDFVYAKAAGDRFRSLAAGAVDAAIVNPPSSFKAADLGLTNVGEISTSMKGFPFTVWTANMNWAAQNRPALSAFAKAYLQATVWLYSPANEKQAIDILEKYAKVNQTDAKSSYDYLVTRMKAFSADGAIDDDAFSKMTTALLEMGDIKKPVPAISTFYDGSFLPAH